MVGEILSTWFKKCIMYCLDEQKHHPHVSTKNMGFNLVEDKTFYFSTKYFTLTLEIIALNA